MLHRWGNLRPNSKPLTRFHSVRSPSNNIEEYIVARISRYCFCSSEAYIMSFVYVDRVVTTHHEKLAIDALTVHRLFVTALVVAAKFYDDVYYSNLYYARVAGIPLKEMNLLERQFLALLNWNLTVSPAEYEKYRSMIESVDLGDATQAATRHKTQHPA